MTTTRVKGTDATHDPQRRSWVERANDGDSDFPIQNLPLGVFTLAGEDGARARGGVAIGDRVIDLAAVARLDLLDGTALDAVRMASRPTLNALMAAGSAPRQALRAALSELLAADASESVRTRLGEALAPMDAVTMHVPARIGGFTDFFTSLHHAARAGRISRPNQPLPPAFQRLPMGYNSRANSVAVSGTDFHRPWGIRQATAEDTPNFGRSEAIDFELEVGAYVAGDTRGLPIGIDAARGHLFGLCLVNDWSSRDLQRAESFPLGPFLAKSSMTTVSPWIVTAEALAPFRAALERAADDLPSPDHLRSDEHDADGAIAVRLTAAISTERMRAAGEGPAVLTRTDLRNLHWTFDQMIAHHVSGGCRLEPGDLLGSGTVSGAERSSAACLFELCIAPDAPRFDPVPLPNGEERRWLLDGDEIVLNGRAEAAGLRSIGFGECRARVVPAHPYPVN